MYNLRLAAMAQDMVIEYCQNSRICMDSASILKRIENWYNHTEITDPSTLAACAIYGDYDPSLKYNDIRAIKQLIFK